MKQILSDFSLASAFAFIALVVGCAHTQQTENLLSAAGFRTVIATTPQQQQHLKTLPPYKVMRVQRNGKTHYVYADPAHNLIYVGGLFQYDQYRDLRLAKNMAAEDLQDARLNADDEMGWQVWGSSIELIDPKLFGKPSGAPRKKPSGSMGAVTTLPSS